MSTITTRFNKVALMVVAAGMISGPAFATANQNGKTTNNSSESPEAKITICHATNAQTNPYVKITVSANAIANHQDFNGHGKQHEGGVWVQGIADHSWGDIIPAFTTKDGVKFPGQNMNEAGKKILDGGCVIKANVPKEDEDKGRPVHTLPTEDKDSKNDDKDHKSNGQGSNDDKKDDTKVTPAQATELPHTGTVASTMGVVGIVGASTYAIARRFMK